MSQGFGYVFLFMNPVLLTLARLPLENVPAYVFVFAGFARTGQVVG